MNHFFRLTILFSLLQITIGNAQTITHGDGSTLITKYCYEDIDYEIAGQPAGGTFSGCGVFQQSGAWYFNPVVATIGVTVFPVQCTLTYTVNGNSVNRNILIYKPVAINPPLLDTFTCTGDIFLHAETLYAGDYDYSWTPANFLTQPDSPATTGFIPSTQIFVVTATDVTSGCAGSDTVVVSRYPTPVLTVSNDTTVVAREQVPLFASGADTYNWSPPQWLDNPASATPIAMPQAAITYTVTGTNSFGCTASADVKINIVEDIFMPNAFSPNGDGLNDEFKIVNFGYQELQDYRIFNRWGQEVFSSRDGAKGWNGEYNGYPADVGTYHYYVRLKLRSGEVKAFKGDLQLLR